MSFAGTAHLSLGQHRYNFNPRQRAPGRDKALEAQHGAGAALDPAVVLLDSVVEPPSTAVAREAPQVSC